MNISFSSVDEAYIRQMIEAGFYANPTELIRDAVRRLREMSESKGDFDNPIYEAVMKAERNIANGAPLIPYTSALMNDMMKNASIRASRGEKPSPDVIPQ